MIKTKHAASLDTFTEWLREGIVHGENFAAFDQWADIHFVDGQRYWNEHQNVFVKGHGPFPKARGI